MYVFMYRGVGGGTVPFITESQNHGISIKLHIFLTLLSPKSIHVPLLMYLYVFFDFMFCKVDMAFAF